MFRRAYAAAVASRHLQLRNSHNKLGNLVTSLYPSSPSSSISPRHPGEQPGSGEPCARAAQPADFHLPAGLHHQHPGRLFRLPAAGPTGVPGVRRGVGGVSEQNHD